MPRHLLIATIAVLILTERFAFAGDSPELVYQKYSEAIKSKNVDKLNKYLSSRQRDKLNEESPEDRLKVIELVAAFMPRSIRITEKTLSPDEQKASLKLVGVGGISGHDQVFGKVLLVKEQSEWKIDREEWSMNSH